MELQLLFPEFRSEKGSFMLMQLILPVQLRPVDITGF